jgi:hypothetical protein
MATRKKFFSPEFASKLAQVIAAYSSKPDAQWQDSVASQITRK